jgi:hypothetical protein
VESYLHDVASLLEETYNFIDLSTSEIITPFCLEGDEK